MVRKDRLVGLRLSIRGCRMLEWVLISMPVYKPFGFIFCVFSFSFFFLLFFLSTLYLLYVLASLLRQRLTIIMLLRMLHH